MRPITRLALTLVLALAWMVPAFADAPSIVVDGQRLPADVPALVSGDHVLVPLRGVFQRLGAHVSYDASAQIASASLGGTVVRVAIGTRDAWVNGEHRTLDVGAREVAGRVMIPLRFVAQALGVAVDYDGPSNTVVIVSGFKPGSFAAGNYSSSGQVSYAGPKVAPSVEDERPGSGELIGSQYPSIYARFSGGTSPVNPSSVRLVVDGVDVTDGATISSAYVSYTPSTALQTGQHSVSISGAADDGTPFSASWTFRIDAGSSSIYTASGGFGASFDGAGFPGFGFSRFGFSPFGFPGFGFFPPGFSVFTPGTLFFVSGNVIEVIFVSRFFAVPGAFFNPFFTISGFPGTFPLIAWPGNPGFFWGFATVPFGVTAHNAIIAANFPLPDGRKVIVHSTAPLQIEGRRTSLPPSLHYAVLPRLIGRPTSPQHLVVFRRLEPVTLQSVRPASPAITHPAPGPQGGAMHIGHAAPVVIHPPTIIRPAPVVIRPASVMHPMLRPAPIITHPEQAMLRPWPGSVSQWQVIGPSHPAMPVLHLTPR